MIKIKNKKQISKFTTGPALRGSKGFTLIELMVSISIFMMIMLMAMGALFISLDAVRRVRAGQSAVDSVNYAIESMTRSIRLGTSYYCGRINNMTDSTSVLDCSNGDTQVSFVPQNYNSNGNYRTHYMRSSRADGTYTIRRCVGATIDSSCPEIVSKNVDIKEFKVFVNGTSPSVNSQPSIFILIKGEVKYKDKAVSFALQTLATQRNLKY